jgi:uncharacterized membrane protein
MTRRVSLKGIVLVFALLLAAACGAENSDIATGSSSTAAADCSGTVPTYTDLAEGVLAKCASCHSSTLSGTARHNAPANVNYDTFSGAAAAAEIGMQEVSRGEMPPPASGISVTDAEKEWFYTWASCGTPD